MEEPKWVAEEQVSEYGKQYIWWLGHLADRLQGRHGISMDNLFALINGADPDTKEVLQEFLFFCFRDGEEPADCADRIIAQSADKINKGHPTGEPMFLGPAVDFDKRPSIIVDGQVREKGMGK